MSNRTTRNTHTERTEAGEQLLANGIQPIAPHDRLAAHRTETQSKRATKTL